MVLGLIKKFTAKDQHQTDDEALDKFQQAEHQLEHKVVPVVATPLVSPSSIEDIRTLKLQKEVSQIKESITDKVKTIDKQHSEIRNLEEEINALYVQYRASYQDLKKYELIRQKNQQRIENLKNKKNKIPSREQLLLHTEKLKGELLKQKQFYETEKGKYFSRKNDIQLFLNKEKVLREKIKQQKSCNTVAIKKVRDLELDLNLLQASISEYAEKYEYYKEQIEPFIEKEERLKKQIEALKSSSSEKDESVLHFNKKMTSLKSSIHKKTQELIKLEDEFEAKANSLQERSEEIKKLEAKFSKIESKAKDQNSKLSGLIAQEKHMGAIVNQHKIRNAELLNHMATFEKRYEALNSSLQQKAEEAKELENKLSAESETFKEQSASLSVLSQAIALEEKRINELQESLKLLLQQARDFAGRIDMLEKKLETSKKEKERSEIHCQKLSIKIKEQQSYMGELEKRVEFITRQKQEMAKKEQQLEVTLGQTERTRLSLEAKVKENEAVALAYSREVKKKEAILKEKNLEIHKLQERLNTLITEVNKLEALDLELDEEISIQEHLQKTKPHRLTSLEEKKQTLINEVDSKKKKRQGFDLPV